MYTLSLSLSLSVSLSLSLSLSLYIYIYTNFKKIFRAWSYKSNCQFHDFSIFTYLVNFVDKGF